LKKLAIILLANLYWISPIAALEPGGEKVYDLFSPTFLGTSANSTYEFSPQSDLSNPALSGGRQRTILDLSYIGLMGADSGAAVNGYGGHVVNIGGSFPTRYGVFGGSFHYLNSNLTGMNLGSVGMLHFNASKDIFSDFYVGTGLGIDLGTSNGFDWGAGLDLGVYHLPMRIGKWEDISWGLSLLNIGKTISSPQGPLPAPFTLQGSFSAPIIQKGESKVLWHNTMSFPYFQNLSYNTGLTLQWKDNLKLNTALKFDLRETLEGSTPWRSFLPSLSLSYSYTAGGGSEEEIWKNSEYQPSLGFSPFNNNIYAFGAGLNMPLGVFDSEAPKISVTYPEPIYISPNNDGIQDDLTFPFEIEDRRYIKGYQLRVLNSKGDIIRVIENKEVRPETINLENLWSRLIEKKSGIPIPDTLRWDGSGDTEGVVPDGEYQFIISAVDDNGNYRETQVYSITVDNTSPSLDIEDLQGPDLIFSPNGDGNKDIIEFVQQGSQEKLWKGQILNNAGEVVKNYRFENKAPETIQWDGTNDAGVTVLDGVYSYQISATDLSGNSLRKSIDNIIVNTEVTPVTLTIDTAFLSPNNDGRKDFLSLKPSVPVKEGIRDWRINIYSRDNQLQRTLTGEDPAVAPEGEILFDGRDEQGKLLQEGRYYATLEVFYVNGNAPENKSPQFEVDLTPPKSSIKVSGLPVFSPNGDGKRDVLTIFQETSSEIEWFGEIRQEDDTVYTVSWIEKADAKFQWNGASQGGPLAKDGVYSYILYAYDKAGNYGSQVIENIELNTTETEILLSLDQTSFSPNNDSVKDRLKMYPVVKVPTGIGSYKIEIQDGQDNPVRTFEGSGSVPEEIQWDGFNNQGAKAPDGTYSALFEVSYLKGDVPTSRSQPFVIDTKYPELAVSVPYTLFSPNEDGLKDGIPFDQESSTETSWVGEVTNLRGEIVFSKTWKGTAEPWFWNGTDINGNILPDGVYSYSVSSQDPAGNKTTQVIENLTIDNRRTKAFLTVDKKGFSPNGDGVMDTLLFSTLLSDPKGVDTWILNIENSQGQIVKSFTGEGGPPKSITWDGKNKAGMLVDGLYTAEFKAIYAKGDQPSMRTPEITLDAQSPVVNIKISPVPFSPDNDGVDDEVLIGLDVRDLSPIKDWSLTILDPEGNPFYSLQGEGAPAQEILWDGKSFSGELVQAAADYTAVLNITDVLENSSQAEGLIPVDVLVIKDGDRLKIAISSITFAPNSPDLSTQREQGSNNDKILKRLAEILNKYGQYKIQIEGHAVRIFWNDPQKGAEEEKNELIPLSTARAEVVKKALQQLGINGSRMSVVGVGGSDPVVPHSDLDNRWKNRRVEFILIK